MTVHKLMMAIIDNFNRHEIHQVLMQQKQCPAAGDPGSLEAVQACSHLGCTISGRSSMGSAQRHERMCAARVPNPDQIQQTFLFSSAWAQLDWQCRTRAPSELQSVQLNSIAHVSSQLWQARYYRQLALLSFEPFPADEQPPYRQS